MTRHTTIRLIAASLVSLSSLLAFLQVISGWVPLLFVVGYGIVLTVGISSITRQYFLPALCSIPGNQPQVALTFDDGPIPDKTERILDILKAEKVPATFFCVGSRILSSPEIVERIHREGHAIGNHSFTHRVFFALNAPPVIEQELSRTDTVLRKTIGHSTTLFRPPWGITTPWLRLALNRTRHTTVGWSLRTFDFWRSNPNRILKRIQSKLQPGSIILLHEYSDATITALPAIIRHIKNQGFELCSLPPKVPSSS